MLVGSTEEQLRLGESVRSVLGDLAGPQEVRRLMATDDGLDDAGWARLHDLGLVGLTVPEHLGGSGGTLADLGVVLEEMGRRVFPGPYFATAALAVTALLSLPGDEAAEDYLARIAEGRTIATLAVTEDAGGWAEAGRWEDSAVQTRASRAGGGWRLDGRKTYVPDGARADLILVAARTPAGLGLFAVEAGAHGLTRALLPTMDQTRKQARLEFASTPARLLGTHGGTDGGADGPAWAGLPRTVEIAAVALAAEQVGGAQAVLDLVLEHARTRHQFGRPIGSFQAVQHACATMVLDLEAARSAAYYGLRTADGDGADLPACASLAKAYCSSTYRRATDAAVQIFGGIGLTWEHQIHLYLKRARSSELLLGSPAQHRERVAHLIGL